MPQPNPYTQVLLTGATTGAAVTNLSSFTNVKLFIQGTGAITTGAVVIKESRTQGISGATIATYTGADLTTGAEVVYAAGPQAYAWFIVQISPAIGGGGSISAEVRAI